MDKSIGSFPVTAALAPEVNLFFLLFLPFVHSQPLTSAALRGRQGHLASLSHSRRRREEALLLPDSLSRDPLQLPPFARA